MQTISWVFKLFEIDVIKKYLKYKKYQQKSFEKLSDWIQVVNEF